MTLLFLTLVLLFALVTLVFPLDFHPTPACWSAPAFAWIACDVRSRSCDATLLGPEMGAQRHRKPGGSRVRYASPDDERTGDARPVRCALGPEVLTPIAFADRPVDWPPRVAGAAIIFFLACATNGRRTSRLQRPTGPRPDDPMPPTTCRVASSDVVRALGLRRGAGPTAICRPPDDA